MSQEVVYASCPEYYIDVNPWVYCQGCPSRQKCYGDMHIDDIIREIERRHTEFEKSLEPLARVEGVDSPLERD